MQTKTQTTGLPLSRGRITRPQKAVIYGPEGVGKSTLASQAPDAVFLDTEGGTHHLDVIRLDEASSWEEIKATVARLATAQHPFKSLVIDTADWLEKRLSGRPLAQSTHQAISDRSAGRRVATPVSERVMIGPVRLSRSLEAGGLRVPNKCGTVGSFPIAGWRLWFAPASKCRMPLESGMERFRAAMARLSAIRSFSPKIATIKWRRQRCTVEISNPAPGLKVDVRRHGSDPSSTVAASIKEVEPDGLVSLLVTDESLEGKPVTLVLLSPSNEPIAKADTTVGS